MVGRRGRVSTAWSYLGVAASISRCWPAAAARVAPRPRSGRLGRGSRACVAAPGPGTALLLPRSARSRWPGSPFGVPARLGRSSCRSSRTTPDRPQLAALARSTQIAPEQRHAEHAHLVDHDCRAGRRRRRSRGSRRRESAEQHRHRARPGRAAHGCASAAAGPDQDHLVAAGAIVGEEGLLLGGPGPAGRVRRRSDSTRRVSPNGPARALADELDHVHRRRRRTRAESRAASSVLLIGERCAGNPVPIQARAPVTDEFASAPPCARAS